MIIVISPAKALDFETPLPALPLPATQPDFLDDAAELVDLLRPCAPAGLAALMKISDRLASLNVARYADWSRPFTAENARPALFAFDGDVYDGLAARSLDAAGLAWVQAHVRILSGLYGVLRPLDLIRAYRLEMGTRLGNARGGDLYAFWEERIGAALAALLRAEAENTGVPPVLVNLASGEYFKAVRAGMLAARIVTPVFEDWKAGRYRVIGFYAKRARGLMCRYAADRRIAAAAELRGFEGGGYTFVAEASGDDTWVFRRRQDGAGDS
ncbi:MAG: peroxide stress protein YaaA [Azoarcus sp.]|jgi:cytoplasmic iron level regulating protein YaaA (DUF328/UPF0246 family)|nr:peroxide stress protein YaaA [Azoarcus sp.]